MYIEDEDVKQLFGV